MDEIFVVDPATKSTRSFKRVAFSAMGIHERKDLQEWLLGNPEILGEPLCIITSEFSGFDKSSRRLDVLAIDAEGTLVVIELKLDVERTFADLQALRYAAFCSTMTMGQVVGEYALFHEVSGEEATRQLSDFLGVDDELPEPSDRPRIILVAGLMDDPEITSTVLWLRSFGIEIRCLEITPYQIEQDQILIVPRTIIPLPEAEEYQVRVERKDATRAQKERERGEFSNLFDAIGREFERFGCPLRRSQAQPKLYRQVLTGVGGWHYEWMVRVRDERLDVAVHFEDSVPARNAEFLEVVKSKRNRIASGIVEPFEIEPQWGKRGWAYAAFVMPLQRDPGDGYAEQAAKLMATLIERTKPALSEIA